MKGLLPVSAFLILAVLMHADAGGQEPNPAPEMKPLERLLGTWDVEQTTKVPDEGRSANTVKRELVLGGRFVQEMGGFDENGKAGHMGTYTYDSNKRIYRWWFFHSSGFYHESTGTWNERSQTFTFVNRFEGGGAGTTTIHFQEDTTFDFAIIVKDGGGKVTYHLEGTAVRQE